MATRRAQSSEGQQRRVQRATAAIQPNMGFESPWLQIRSAGTHPFLYQKMIGAVDPRARAGDVVQVYERDARLFGRGLYNPNSQIALRMLVYGDTPVDDAFWRTRLGEAVELRRQLRLDEQTDCYRLVHAEGDRVSGLIAERVADCLVLEIFSLGIYQRRDQIAAALQECLGPYGQGRPLHSSESGAGVPFRKTPEQSGAGVPARKSQQQNKAGNQLAGTEARTTLGADTEARTTLGAGAEARTTLNAWRVFTRIDDHIAALERIPRDAGLRDSHPRDAGPRESALVTIREHGVRYTVDITGGHKTGFFCDQRDNRLRFGRLCQGLRVLDLCCYTGGFGLCAKLLGGAAEVTSVDLDEKALALARENANRNQTRINHVHADAFIYLRQMNENKRRFDAVVLDPPKFARTRDEYESALIRYNDLNTLAMQVVRPGGLLLTCSCSGLVGWPDFTATVHSAARRAARTLQLLDRTGAAADHPVSLDCPESQYLKALWLRVM